MIAILKFLQLDYSVGDKTVRRVEKHQSFDECNNEEKNNLDKNEDKIKGLNMFLLHLFFFCFFLEKSQTTYQICAKNYGTSTISYAYHPSAIEKMLTFYLEF